MGFLRHKPKPDLQKHQQDLDTFLNSNDLAVEMDLEYPDESDGTSESEVRLVLARLTSLTQHDPNFELQEANREIARLKRSLNAYDDQLRAAKHFESQLLHEIGALQQMNKALNTQLSEWTGPGALKFKQARALRQENDNLHRELAKLQMEVRDTGVRSRPAYHHPAYQTPSTSPTSSSHQSPSPLLP